MKYFFFLLMSAMMVVTSCNDSQLVGSDLLGDQSADVEYIDDLALSAKTVLSDSIITFLKFESDNFANGTYLVGNIDDPEFGKSSATTFFTPTLLRDTFPRLSVFTLDSVVMVMELDSTGQYGDKEAVHDLELYNLVDRLDNTGRDTFFSNETYEVESAPIVTRSQGINYTDSLEVGGYIFTNPDSTVLVPAQLRFRLDNQYWIDLSQSGGDFLELEEFNQFVPGYELRSATANNSMLGVNLFYNGNSPQQSNSTINVYYQINDSTRTVFILPLGRYRHSYLENDYAGSALEANLDKTTADCFYLQSQQGTNVEVDISSAKSISDRILNFAELEVSVKSFDENLYPPIEAISAWYRNEDGEFVRADRSDEIARVEETYPQGEQLYTYKIDITAFINQVKKGEIDADQLTLIAVSKAQRANRSLIYGPDDPDHPMKLNLTLTKP